MIRWSHVAVFFIGWCLVWGYCDYLQGKVAIAWLDFIGGVLWFFIWRYELLQDAEGQ